MLPRFNYIARDIPEALAYYQNRAIQLLSSGWSWDGTYTDLGWGIHIYLIQEGISYDSVYVLKKGQGHLRNWFKTHDHHFVSMPGCEAMYNWLRKNNLPFTLATPYDSDSYNKVAVFYGDRRAKRSNVFYMNHIDEGLYILNKLQANQNTLDAYCLHPIYQANKDIKKLYDTSDWKRPLFKFDNPDLIILTMEYRNIANAYLPKRVISTIEDIELSPLPEVNMMLWADKIQNRKDFERYHLSSHPNAERLERYFQDWFHRLGIPEDFYQECVQEIDGKTGR